MQRSWILLVAAACGGGDPGSTGTPPIPADTAVADGVETACAGSATYPEGAVEPMALGEVLAPYRWPVAVDRRTGARGPLDLADVPCDLDAEHGWGQFEALLFVSIPAW